MYKKKRTRKNDFQSNFEVCDVIVQHRDDDEKRKRKQANLIKATMLQVTCSGWLILP